MITMSLPESGNRRNRRCSRRDTRRWSMSAITGSLFLSPAARAAARVAQAPRPPSSADGATAVCSRSSSVPCAVLIAALAHQRGQRGAARNVLHAAQRPGADTAAKAQHSTQHSTAATALRKNRVCQVTRPQFATCVRHEVTRHWRLCCVLFCDVPSAEVACIGASVVLTLVLWQASTEPRTQWMATAAQLARRPWITIDQVTAVLHRQQGVLAWRMPFPTPYHSLASPVLAGRRVPRGPAFVWQPTVSASRCVAHGQCRRHRQLRSTRAACRSARQCTLPKRKHGVRGRLAARPAVVCAWRQRERQRASTFWSRDVLLRR